MTVKKITAKIFLVFSFFLLGLAASTYQVGERSWVPAAIDKSKQILGIVPKFDPASFYGFSSQRYEFNTFWRFSNRGVFQLATTKDFLYGIDRHNGDLFEFTLSKKNAVSKNVNLYSILGISKSNKANQLPLVMDLHVVGDKLFSSIVKLDNSKCERLYLYETKISKKTFADTNAVFKTPCIKDHTNAQMWGGRMTNSQTKLYLSVGEQRYDRSGFPKQDKSSRKLLRDQNSVFGSVLEFDLKTQNITIFSKGHRNAQGLYFDPESLNLLESEHGPFGGDEVNMLVKNGNYGWPFGSFGKPYPKKYPSGKSEINESKNPSIGVDLALRKFGAVSGSQSGFNKPLFSWSPGVGPGNLVMVSSHSKLIEWRRNIIIALMGQGTIHRLILENGAVIHDEKIDIGKRIRDFVLTEDGKMFASTDNGELVGLDTYLTSY